MNGRLLLVTVAAIGLVLLLTWPLRHPGQRHPTRNRRLPATAPAPNAAETAAAPTTADAARLLPFSPQQVLEASQLACAFTAAYATHRYNEDPDDYLRRLIPMTHPQLRPILQRTAHDPAILVERHRLRENAIGRARTTVIRALGPSSITFLITATEQVTTEHAVRHDTTRYAVTVIRNHAGWQIYTIDLATTGDAGDSSGTVATGDTS